MSKGWRSLMGMEEFHWVGPRHKGVPKFGVSHEIGVSQGDGSCPWDVGGPMGMLQGMEVSHRAERPGCDSWVYRCPMGLNCPTEGMSGVLWGWMPHGGGVPQGGVSAVCVLTPQCPHSPQRTPDGFDSVPLKPSSGGTDLEL